MKKTTLIVIGVLAILVIGGAAQILRSSSNDDKNTSPTPTSSNATESKAPTAPILIRYTNSGFTPVKVSVKAGTQITILNDSSSELDFNSDPHPSHTDNAEFNVGKIAQGEDKTFAVTKLGTWGYHNHLNPDDKGSIVVQ